MKLFQVPNSVLIWQDCFSRYKMRVIMKQVVINDVRNDFSVTVI